jgi:arsenate reductase (glutaredoxin)
MECAMILYGLSTCDTCKKAQKALVAAGHDVTFRDVRAAPLTDAEIAEFITEFGSRIINTQSTTYRGLSDWMKASEADHQLREYPALMKRPVIRSDAGLTLGWDDQIAAKFA